MVKMFERENSRLVSKIMDDLYLDGDPKLYWGSSICKYLKSEVLENLPTIIKKYNKEGEPISPPNEKLIDILEHVPIKGRDSYYFFNDMWEATLKVVSEHINQYSSSPRSKGKAYRNLIEDLEKKYL